MADKKKETKKTAAKKAPIKAKVKNEPKAPVKQEEAYPAINIAHTFGISDFAFYMIKEAKGLHDSTPITITQFQEYYKEVIEGR